METYPEIGNAAAFFKKKTDANTGPAYSFLSFLGAASGRG